MSTKNEDAGMENVSDTVDSSSDNNISSCVTDKTIVIPEDQLKTECTEKSSNNDDVPKTSNIDENNANPYAYLNRDEFSSEKYKIEIKGLPKFYGFKEFKKLLNNKLNLNAHKIKPPKSGPGPNSTYVFVSFKTEEDRESALKVLNGYKWKNKILSAVYAKAVEDPLVRKRTQQDCQNDGPEGFLPEETIEEAVKRATIPLWNVPYEQQLSMKQEAVAKTVQEICKQVTTINGSPMAAQHLSSKLSLDPIKPSPVIQGYRNKCEFTIGLNKVIGFRASSYKKGSVEVGGVEHLVHLPQVMKKVVLEFEKYVKSSPYASYDAETHEGCWKQLTVRTTTTNQVMVILVVSAKNIPPEDFVSLKENLCTHFGSLQDPQINSFYIKLVEAHGEKHRNAPQLLFGAENIHENLLGLKFSISPLAFFQINSAGAEVLYSQIGSIVDLDLDTTVLDICCGTGTIGLSVANNCAQVIGVEMVESAVEDARRNAAANNLAEKCVYVAGKAEDVIGGVLDMVKFSKVVAIVDPPRSGLHPRVVLLLRRCEKIRKLIYVACDAKAAAKNFIDLARPLSKNYRGTPFLPTKALSVDLFPHCHQRELVLVLERQDDISWHKYMCKK